MSARIATYLIVASLLASRESSPAVAQPRPGTGAIDGVVADTNLVSLADATASIVGSRIQVVTNANGRFRIVGLPAGQYILLLRRLGYASSSTVLSVAERDTLRLSFTLQPVAAGLDTVIVAAPRPRSSRLAEFDERRKAGLGQFMTQAEIEKRNVVYVSDLLQTFRGASGGINVHSGCAFQFFVDGVAVPTPKLDRDLPSPKELGGIEVYTSIGTIPLQYKTFSDKTFSGRGGSCGVILLWTKDGSLQPPEP